jgi:hypothetical protein
MNRFVLIAALGLALTLSVGAQTAAAPAVPDSTKISDLTVGDLKTLAAEQSVALQKAGYIRRAEVASFIIPGLGQYLVGDPLGGTLNWAGQIALVGGTFYAAWALLPSDARAAGGRDRRDLIGHYWTTDPLKVAPSALVMVSGLTLSVLQRFWASDNAGRTARANIQSGKVTFEPLAGPGFLGFRAGF